MAQGYYGYGFEYSAEDRVRAMLPRTVNLSVRAQKMVGACWHPARVG